MSGSFASSGGDCLCRAPGLNKASKAAREAAGLGKDVVPCAIRYRVATELRHRGVPALEPAMIPGHGMPDIRTAGQ